MSKFGCSLKIGHHPTRIGRSFKPYQPGFPLDEFLFQILKMTRFKIIDGNAPGFSKFINETQYSMVDRFRDQNLFPPFQCMKRSSAGSNSRGKDQSCGCTFKIGQNLLCQFLGRTVTTQVGPALRCLIMFCVPGKGGCEMNRRHQCSAGLLLKTQNLDRTGFPA